MIMRSPTFIITYLLIVTAVWVLLTTDKTAAISDYSNTAAITRSSQSNIIVIHLYGGSISYGSCNGCKPFAKLLEDYLYENDIDSSTMEITNFAQPASGPDHWIHCGIGYADIIISEYRLNEKSKPVLEEWYQLAKNSSSHLVVLDLWTWLEPPGLYPSAKVAQEFGLDVLQLDNFPDTWRKFIPLYYNYTNDKIPDRCYVASLEKTMSDQQVIRDCRIAHSDSMQHGTQLYHYAIADQLAMHIKGVVSPQLHKNNTVSKSEEATRGRQGFCIGEWGPKLLYSEAWNDSNSIRNSSGFSVGSIVTQRSDKVTLYAKSTDAQVTLVCPPPYKYARVGYIGHTDLVESGTVKFNDITVKTVITESVYSAHIRIRKYTPQLTLPITVNVGHLESSASIELTELACAPQPREHL